MDQPIGFVRGTVDTLVSRGPVLFYGIVAISDSNGAGIIRLRNGQNVNGQEFMMVTPIVVDGGTFFSETLAVFPPAPILLELGLFVDVVSNISSWTVFYLPVREEQRIARAEALVEGAPE